MKHFVLAFLLFLFSAPYCSAQQVTPRDIVLKSLKKHTSGKKLTQYVVKFEYDKPGKTPAETLLKNPGLMKLDSMMKSTPDSLRGKMKTLLREVSKSSYLARWEEVMGRRQWVFADFPKNKMTIVRIELNRLKGKVDSVSTVSSIDSTLSQDEILKINPIGILQLMANDSTKLRYAGTSKINGHGYHQVLLECQGKWISVYFDLKSNILTHIIETKTDAYPIFGKGPETYMDIVVYKKFKSVDGFFVPNSIEEITNRSDWTTRKKLTWISLNKSIPDSVFKPVAKHDEIEKFRTVHISDSLFVVERQSSSVNSRSLVRLGRNNQLEVFGKMADEKSITFIEKELAGSRMGSMYITEGLYGVADLSGLFDNKIQVIAPKTYGVLSEENIRISSPKEDSIWRASSSAGLLTIFDKEFETENLKVFVHSRYTGKPYQFLFVCYHLPKEKVVYLHGNPYSAQKEKQNASLGEKQLYDWIISGKIAAEKIVYSDAYLDNAPVFMTIQDFEKRIKNTDFSVYKNRNEE